MLAGGIVEPGVGNPGQVSAFVAYNPRPGVSRLFKILGPTNGPSVRELPSATTVDLHAFRLELEDELAPALAHISAQGGAAAIAEPKASFVADIVRRHLKTSEGIDVA